MPHSHTDSHSVTHTHTHSVESFPPLFAATGEPARASQTAPTALCTTLSTVHTLYIPPSLVRSRSRIACSLRTVSCTGRVRRPLRARTLDWADRRKQCGCTAHWNGRSTVNERGCTGHQKQLVTAVTSLCSSSSAPPTPPLLPPASAEWEEAKEPGRRSCSHSFFSPSPPAFDASSPAAAPHPLPAAGSRCRLSARRPSSSPLCRSALSLQWPRTARSGGHDERPPSDLHTEQQQDTWRIERETVKRSVRLCTPAQSGSADLSGEGGSREV